MCQTVFLTEIMSSENGLTIVERPVRRKPVKRARKGKLGLTALVKRLDVIFSKYIRAKYPPKCFTCGYVGQMQAGHYITRHCKAIRWDERNCRPQCYACNILKRGDAPTFRENLIKELGEAEVLEIESDRHKLLKPTEEWLLSQLNEYTEKLKTYAP